MTLQLLHSEFPYIWEKFDFLFYQYKMLLVRRKSQSLYTSYLEYHSVGPLVRIGTPHPLSRKRMCTPTPEPKGGTLACGWGGGGSQFGRLEKNPCLLYAYTGGREKSSGQAHLFNIWTAGATGRTSGQPMVELSLWWSISFKIGPLESKTKTWPGQQIQLLETEKTKMCTLQGKSRLCNPFLGIAQPQSQFPHWWCVCEQFIYSQDRSTYFPAAE